MSTAPSRRRDFAWAFYLEQAFLLEIGSESLKLLPLSSNLTATYTPGLIFARHRESSRRQKNILVAT